MDGEERRQGSDPLRVGVDKGGGEGKESHTNYRNERPISRLKSTKAV